MIEMPNQSIDDIVKNDLNYIMDVPSSTLRNHRIGRDGGKRDLYITADIRPQDLKVNNIVEPAENIRKWISKDGYPCDEPGLVVPAEFGGTAEAFNIIPWSKFMKNTAALDKDKQEVREYLSEGQPNRWAQLEFAFEYIDNAEKFFRPIFILYRFTLHEDKNIVKQMGTILSNSMKQ